MLHEKHAGTVNSGACSETTGKLKYTEAAKAWAWAILDRMVPKDNTQSSALWYHFFPGPCVPTDYKDIEKYVQSFRYDVIMKAGLDIARNKVEDAFYGNKLWLNGQKLIKKSKLVKVGDTLDMVLSENKDTDTITLLRVIIKKELGESKDGDKYKVVLRRWKNLQLPKQDVFKK
ncbi:hypothetical protein DPEC_G00294740 [Dallia pectoralis]|uniref:Uncharacterized protein n=1 Tax=Dallia pectoralis TaxID=75939 RepID=A0ACC2FIL1_DALPE|nr:hypothetical protein DPEC_G00294740 [Dallia pectoralis]